MHARHCITPNIYIAPRFTSKSLCDSRRSNYANILIVIYNNIV